MNKIVPRTMESGGSRIPPANVPLPGRLMPITRAPEREENRTSKTVSQSAPEFVMYISYDNCRHSRELVRLVQHEYKIPCKIVDISIEGIPSWITGTPNIVVGTDVYCGDTAFNYVESYGQLQKEQPVGLKSSVEDIVSGKSKKDNTKGCGLSDAFCAPTQMSEEEASQRHSGSVEDAMAKLMASRG